MTTPDEAPSGNDDFIHGGKQRFMFPYPIIVSKNIIGSKKANMGSKGIMNRLISRYTYIYIYNCIFTGQPPMLQHNNGVNLQSVKLLALLNQRCKVVM